ncbi:MAG: DUF368 domain-containing protein [Reichenbachiella sp.]
MKSLKESLLLFFKGVGMGSADIIPGVSGGTIALITGIYGELLDSINSFDFNALKLLATFKLKDFWNHINGSFLFPLFAGIGLSVVTLAKVLSFVLENHPIQIWSFFFGLIIISSISVAKEIKNWNVLTIVSGLVGVGIAYGITVVTPASTPNELWFIFLCGSLAICAMILPGISGSFILLLLGQYSFVLNALKEFNLLVIIVFMAGCVTGLLSFSRLISWFLNKFHGYAIALLAGFMIGSLNKIWPWKKAELFRMNSHGEQVPLFERNLLPTEYFDATGNPPMIIQAILFMAFGFMIVVILEKVALMINSSKENKSA